MNASPDPDQIRALNRKLLSNVTRLRLVETC